jgi:glycosyltransferase involved in cell wall biosynthesis
MKKLAFVVPWFGKSIPGGAESVAAGTVSRLRKAGVPVEILTTCLRQLQSDWSTNYYRPATENIGGMAVRRFAVAKRNTEQFARINSRLMQRLPLTPQEQASFVREMIRCDELTDFIQRNRSSYIYAFIPYLFSTTYWGALACPESSVLIPCLHDEGYAYLDPFRPLFETVRGLIFHSRSEMNLANRLYRLRPDSQICAGAGIETNVTGDACQFEEKYRLKPFALYVGRKDDGKNVPLLVKYFCQYKDRFPSELKLVLIGPGTVDIPDGREHEIIDLGVVSAEDKRNACAAALVVCQPSINESFSLVLMEAWLNETPVLVHSSCAATREHCLASGGGLYFSWFNEFCGCMQFFSEKKAARQRMGHAGKRYVLANYSWDRVIKKYLAAFEAWGFRF